MRVDYAQTQSAQREGRLEVRGNLLAGMKAVVLHPLPLGAERSFSRSDLGKLAADQRCGKAAERQGVGL